MLGLGRRFLQQQAADGQQQCASQIEQLVQRLSEAVLIGDRRDALQQIRDLLASGGAEAQLAFGAVGAIPAMLLVVRDREDVEMVQLALECLAAAVGGGGGDDAGATKASTRTPWPSTSLPRPRLLSLPAAPAIIPSLGASHTWTCMRCSQAAAINAQQLAREGEGLPLLLSLLEPGPAGVADFYARYHTMQVFKGMVAAAPHLLQEVSEQQACSGSPCLAGVPQAVWERREMR